MRPSPRLAFGCLAAMVALLPAPAVAQNALSFQSQPGDPVGLGDSRTITPAVDAILDVYKGNSIGIGAFPGDDYYFLTITASDGAPLGVGTYENAGWPHSDTSRPSVSFSANGRQCEASTGRFTIHEIKLGFHDYVEKLRLSFEQQCAGAPGKLVGTATIDNPPGPPLVELDVQWDKHAVLEPWGAIRLTGTSLCSKPGGDLGLGVRLAQQRGRQPTVEGTPDRPLELMDCTTERRPIVARVTPRGGQPFVNGPATLHWTSMTWDRDYSGAAVTRTGETKVVILPAPARPAASSRPGR